MELDTLKELYVEGLKDLYSAENQIIKAMPKMIKKASHPELKRAFTQHLRQTEQQAKRLERICRELGVKPTGKKCVGMKGLIDEAKELIAERPDPDVLDAGLLAAAQHVEHYEIAGYGTMRTYARQLGFGAQADLLQATLDEEGETDKLLTGIAVRTVNVDAETPDDDESGGRGSRTSGAKRGGARKKGGAGRGTASKKRSSRRGASSRGALARHSSGGLHDRAKALIGA